MEIEGKIEVDQKIQEVFDYLTDYQNRVNFISFIDKVRLDTPQSKGVGTRYTEFASVLGQQLETTYEVIAFDPPQAVSVKSINAPFPIRSDLKLSGISNRTVVKITLNFELKGIFRLAKPLIKNFIQSELNKILKLIKKEVELNRNPP